MAKSTKKAPAKVKKHSSKYSKLAIVAGKELAAKKTALVRAEKALAKAQKTHQELLGEVARLDMLDRSLKALINGTEPPQNIRYVYTYPQWVWNNGYWSNGGYTVTLGATTPTWTTSNGNFQGGQQLCNLTTTGYNSAPSTFGTIQGNGTFNVNTVNSSVASSLTVPSSLSYSSAGDSYSLTSGYADKSNAFTLAAPQAGQVLNAGPSWQTLTDFTVDLSTGQADPEAEVFKPEGAPLPDTDLDEEPAEVGHGG